MAENLFPLTNNLVLSDTGHPGDFNRTIRHVLEGIGTQYSCASVTVGRGDKVLLKFCAGNRQDYSGEIFQNPDPKPVNFDTLYDMASVSKMMSTTMVALRMLEYGRFSPYDSLWRYFDNCGNFRNVEIRHLMTHTSGISPHLPLYAMGIAPDESVRAILDSKPVCGIGEGVNYSCMGYIVLQTILEKIAGRPLDELAADLVFRPLGMDTACYCPKSENVAATEYSPHNHYYICGHVHDENAHFRGGV
ncbi:MAG: beta-lactamase family protein, partial [Clostridia bacterium]|nr:beta-lactamase family protein [Clostridia bacterium]